MIVAILIILNIWPVTSQDVTSYPNTYVAKGVLQPGVTSINHCIHQCRSDDVTKCAGIDFDYYYQQCFVHTSDSECGELIRKDHMVHYRRIDCDVKQDTRPALKQDTTPPEPLTPTTPAPDSPPSLDDLFTKYSETYIPGGKVVPGLKTVNSCYQYCHFAPQCAGFEFNYLRNQCLEHTARTECEDLKIKAGYMHYRLKHNCNPVTESCNNVIIQDLPVGFYRPGGTKIADDIDMEACRDLCKVSQQCQAVDWDVKERTCWQHDTASFPVKGPCCIHSRKVCTDQEEEDNYFHHTNYHEYRRHF